MEVAEVGGGEVVEVTRRTTLQITGMCVSVRESSLNNTYCI